MATKRALELVRNNLLLHTANLSHIDQAVKNIRDMVYFILKYVQQESYQRPIPSIGLRNKSPITPGSIVTPCFLKRENQVVEITSVGASKLGVKVHQGQAKP
jgi:hypothetical protein